MAILGVKFYDCASHEMCICELVVEYSEVSIKLTVSIKHTGQTDFQMFLLSVLYNLKKVCNLINVQVSIKRTGCIKLFVI